MASVIDDIGQQINPQRETLHPREYEKVARYRAYLFGDFRIYRDDELVVCPGSKKNKCAKLLKWFLLNPRVPFSSEELVDKFWPEIDPEQAMGNFHVTMHRLRRVLEPELRPRQESNFLRRSAGNFYRFVGEPLWWTDMDDIELLFRLGRASEARHQPTNACFYFGRVAEYGVRRFLADEDAEAPWTIEARRHFESIYLQALTRLIVLHADAGRTDASLEYVYRLREVDPHHTLEPSSAATATDAPRPVSFAAR